jgi:phospholipase C
MIKRRDFLRNLAGLSGVAAFEAWGVRSALQAAKLVSKTGGLPDPSQSGIQHIVVLMMENRSFDHLLGWMPNSDGQQQGLQYLDPSGVAHPTHTLAPDYTGCGFLDPDHSYEGGRVQYNGGAMDGFLLSADDDFAIGYYEEQDRPFFNMFARNFTALDRSFCAILGPTYPNRFFLHAAQTDRLSNTLVPATMPTIWDTLAAAGVSAQYYYSNLPFLGLWGTTYLPISSPYSTFLIDAAKGTLPAVSFVDPRFTITDDGTGNDDHPHADIRTGDAFLAQTFHALASGPAWGSTVFVVTYDEWGGFFDHVAPPRAAAPNDVDPDLVDGKALLGLRIPTVVASPWSLGDPADPRVQHLVTDHTSILKLIEWRFGLSPLTARDASDDIENLALLLNFDDPRFDVPDLPMPTAPPPEPCLTGSAQATAGAGESENEWLALLNSGLLEGWPLYL